LSSDPRGFHLVPSLKRSPHLATKSNLLPCVIKELKHSLWHLQYLLLNVVLFSGRL
jgi:hypothetical protein